MLETSPLPEDKFDVTVFAVFLLFSFTAGPAKETEIPRMAAAADEDVEVVVMDVVFKSLSKYFK